MKRFALIVTITALLFSTCFLAVYADTPGFGTPVPKQVLIYLKPDISVELNGVRQVFKDANGQTVYPLIYNGTTYLPVRAVSALMKEPVEWDGSSKTVYMGRTLTWPVRSSALIPSGAAAPAEQSDIEALEALKPGLVTGYSKPDVTVMYDFAVQSFKDANGLTVYPLNYKGSVYLPLRAVSRLMKEPIEWDGAAKRISIGDEEEEPEEEEPEEEEPEEPEEENNMAFALLNELFEDEEALYYEASAKVTEIKDSTPEQRQTIAVSASENYLRAQSITSDIKKIDQDDFSDEEKAAYDALLAFAESNEYYILVLENIAYMAAEGSDYSMLADTFLYFAMEAQTKMEEARELIIEEE